MQYHKMGKTGLKVSAVCLGTMTFGVQVVETDAIKIIDTAYDMGVNFFDTANGYADGHSEEITGKALKNKRKDVVLASKVGSRIGPGVNQAGLSRKSIMQEVENSLSRLGTDYLDIYYAHLPDYSTPIEETLRAFDDLVHQGKVRYVACSNFRAWQLCKALWVSDKENLERFNCIQPPYNLLTRDIETELLPLAQDEGLGVCVYNPLAAGLLTGKHDSNKPPAAGTRFAISYKTKSGTTSMGESYSNRYWQAADFAAVERFRVIAQSCDCSMAQFSLAWILQNPVITATIIGATSLRHLEENLKTPDIKLSADAIKACDAVWAEFRPPRFFYGR